MRKEARRGMHLETLPGAHFICQSHITAKWRIKKAEKKKKNKQAKVTREDTEKSLCTISVELK